MIENLVDTHCHIYHHRFDQDIKECLIRSRDAGVRRILMPAIDRSSTQKMQQLPEVSGLELLPMAGIHPCDVHESDLLTVDELTQWATQSKAVGIGETGLDYYWSKEFIELQKQSLRIHFEVAKSLQLPVVLHNRESTSDFLDEVEKAQDGRLTGVWHCFNGSVEEGKRAIDAGLYLGLGGVITFKKGGMDAVIPHLPVDRFILETDAPFLAPTPHRGKRNEPAYIPLVLAKLAEYTQMTEAELAAITTQNAENLFNLQPLEA